MDIEALNPTIRELVKKAKVTPTAEEYAILKTIKIAGVAEAFEAKSVMVEKTDEKRYHALIGYVQDKEATRLAAIRAEEEKKNAVERAKKEAEEKKKREEEEKILAAERAKKEAEEAKVRAAEEKKRKEEEAVQAKLRAAEEAKAAEERKKREAEEEAARKKKEAEEFDKAQKASGKFHGKCSYDGCKNPWIPKEEKRYFQCGEDEYMHADCLEPWREAGKIKCAASEFSEFGGKCKAESSPWIYPDDDFVSVKRGNDTYDVHDECSDSLKEALAKKK